MNLLPVRVVRLVLPYPPRANKYWRLFTPKGRTARPRMIVSTLGRAYKAAVRALIGRRLPGMLTGPLRVDADVFRPRRSGDVDGHVKVLLDTLQQDEEEGWRGLYLNDNQAVRIRVEHWDHEPKKARVQLTVTEDPNPRAPPQDWPLTAAEHRALNEASAQLAEIVAKENARAKEKRSARSTALPPSSVRTQRKLSELAAPASYPPRRKKVGTT